MKSSDYALVTDKTKIDCLKSILETLRYANCSYIPSVEFKRVEDIIENWRDNIIRKINVIEEEE